LEEEISELRFNFEALNSVTRLRRPAASRGKKPLTRVAEDRASGGASMTLKAELLLLGALIAASLVLGHMLEGTGLGTVIQ
jgi:hypothetical protein